MPESSPTAAETTERCAECGAGLRAQEAVVYHGLVYHPACATGVRPNTANSGARLRRDRWPFGVPEFNCTGDL